MIEGGNPGGSALDQSAQRRATADRLLVEAKWWESVADDERRMAAALEDLPPAYALMHDLRLPGSKGNLDHLVVGPGGAFLVTTKRYVEPMDFRDGQLWAGSVPLRGDFDSARVEAQLLTQTLGTPVVPVIAFLDTVLPAAAPGAIDGVLVCSADNVARAIARAAHTLLAPPKVADVAERGLPLLHTPGSVSRTVSAKGVGHDVGADVPTSTVVLPAPLAGRSPDERAAARVPVVAKGKGGAKDRGRGADRGKPSGKPSGKPGEPASGDKPHGARRSLAVVAAAIVSLCLVALAVGSLVRVLGSKVTKSPATTVAGDPGSTVAGTQVTSTTLAAGTGMAAAVAAPPVLLTPTCITKGKGWQFVPAWPGNLNGLKEYAVEVESADGAWTRVTGFVSPETAPAAALPGQPPTAYLTVRITAVMADGSHSVANAVKVTAPNLPC